MIRTPLSKGNKWRFADPKSTSRGSFRAIAATRSGSGRGRGRPRTTLPLSMHLEIDAIFGKTLITRTSAHSTRRADTMAPASVERCVGEFRASLTRGALPSSECVSFGVSKGLSLGIVAGAVLVKVPQINRIVAKGSAKGLRVSMFRSEVLSGTVAIAYFARSGIALAAYAELFFILLQNLVILALIRRYGDGPAKNAKNANESRVSFAVAFAAHAATVALLAFGVLANVPDSALETLYNCTTAVLIAGRARRSPPTSA